MIKRAEKKYIARSWIDNKEGKGSHVLSPLTSTLLDDIDQRALGDYTRVTYINIQQFDNKKSGEKLHSWEIGRW